MAASLPETHIVNQLAGTFKGIGTAVTGYQSRHSHIFKHIEFRQKLMKLKYKTNIFSTESGQLFATQSIHVGIAIIHISPVGRVERAEQLQQSGLAGTTRSDYSHYLAVVDCYIYTLEHLKVVETLVYVYSTYHINDFAIVDMAYSGDTLR